MPPSCLALCARALRAISLRLLLAFGIAGVTQAQSATPAVAEADPVLIENSVVQIRRSDYERELMRLPADVRGGFATNPKRVNDLLRRMLVTRTLAGQAREAKLDQDPETQARMASEIERYLAQLRMIQVEAAAVAEFEANASRYEARARELYTVDKAKYQRPEQVRASHILFDLKRHDKDAGERLAREWRAKILAGEDFNETARKVSGDPSAPQNAGRLDWFVREEMDPAFAATAFALSREGDISEPVLSQFGWHLIRLDGRRSAGPLPFEDVRAEIMTQLKGKLVDERRDEFLAKHYGDASMRTHPDAIAPLIVQRPDPEIIRKALEAAATKGLPGAPPAPR